MIIGQSNFLLKVVFENHHSFKQLNSCNSSCWMEDVFELATKIEKIRFPARGSV